MTTALAFSGLCLAAAAVIAIVALLDRPDEPLGRVTPGTLRRYASTDEERRSK